MMVELADNGLQGLEDLVLAIVLSALAFDFLTVSVQPIPHLKELLLVDLIHISAVLQNLEGLHEIVDLGFGPMCITHLCEAPSCC